MGKAKTIFVCSSCSGSFSKWLGKCPECSEWNTIVEEKAPDMARRGLVVLGASGGPVPLVQAEKSDEDRIETGIGELDRVLGGGIVLGSAVLLGGEPGIGKSTLLLQVMGRLATLGQRVLYVTGEESTRQIRIRGDRLGLESENLLVFPESCVERVIEAAGELKPDVIVVDSVQTVYSETIESPPGSLAQVRDASAILISIAKSTDIPLFIVGHVTKDGLIAGPKVLEHMVDTVLYLEGESAHNYRILRAVKNRYGSATEIGVFEMRDSGLVEVQNPSEVFLAERPVGASGSAVVPCLEGTRTILVEIQSLVSGSMTGIARRTVVGVDLNRVLLLSAVLEKKARMSFAGDDIFIKVAGGLSLGEVAVDLAVVASMVSSHLDKPIDADIVIFGEVGLAGEVRAVSRAAERVAEAWRLGFKRCIMPKGNLKGLKKAKGRELVGVLTIGDAIGALFD
ncbi:MAG: DNA repair protein RadA [Thermodesulfobacteriota bacterium]